MLPFPTSAPYRIDQVTNAPLLAASLTAALLAAATAMTMAAQSSRQRWWTAAALLLLGLVTLLFGLASWGTSDVTKLSHDFAFTTLRVQGEPFWMLMAPLIVRLPYRMALVHGLVAAGYAALGLALARRWSAMAWGPWWALLLVWSPFLHNFLQNGVTRQALMTLLLVPLFLWAGRLAPVRRGVGILCTVVAATVHGAFVGTALLALLARLAVGKASLSQPPASMGSQRPKLPDPRLLAALLVAFGGLLVLVAPIVWTKLQHYTTKENFFNSYALSLPVLQLQVAMAVGIVMVCWLRRLGWRQLWVCGHSRLLAVVALLFWLTQECLRQNWIPAFTSRFVDTTGLFLLVTFLAWLEHYRARWAVLPVLLVTLETWVFVRLPDAFTLRCGQDDAFLCFPDRWPWQVR